ncbi:MAG: rhodanese-like domain-containing protein [Myxococcota bacterium]
MSEQCPWDISVEDLKALRDAGSEYVLLDVREPHEHEICHLEEGQLVPLQTLEGRLGELPRDGHIVVLCRSGMRSAAAVNAMREIGFTNTWNVQGGILAWIHQIDPSLTPY